MRGRRAGAWEVGEVDAGEFCAGEFCAGEFDAGECARSAAEIAIEKREGLVDPRPGELVAVGDDGGFGSEQPAFDGDLAEFDGEIAGGGENGCDLRVLHAAEDRVVPPRQPAWVNAEQPSDLPNRPVARGHELQEHPIGRGKQPDLRANREQFLANIATVECCPTMRGFDAVHVHVDPSISPPDP